MNKANRAAQFNSFDALKGLKEALREKEEKHSRVERRELSEEQQDELSRVIAKIERGFTVLATYYVRGHYLNLQGKVTDINVVFGYIVIGQTKIFFDDISDIKLI